MKTHTPPNVRRTKSMYCAFVLVAAAVNTGISSAQQINLADRSIFGGEINGAQYLIDTTQPAGTGIFARDSRDVFLTIQHDGQEEGYNTQADKIMDTKRESKWNHPISVSDLQTVTQNGISYVPFLLDINESSGGGHNLLVLDDVKIFTSKSNDLADKSLNALLVNPNNVLRYSLDQGASDPSSWVLLDYERSGSGSGRADMGLLIPTSVFAGSSMTDSVYLYSHFGGDFVGAKVDGTSDAGYEEWTLGSGTPVVVPEPSAALLVAFCGLGVCLRRRRV